jgi:hypothetical protein
LDLMTVLRIGIVICRQWQRACISGVLYSHLDFRMPPYPSAATLCTLIRRAGSQLRVLRICDQTTWATPSLRAPLWDAVIAAKPIRLELVDCGDLWAEYKHTNVYSMPAEVTRLATALGPNHARGPPTTTATC